MNLFYLSATKRALLNTTGIIIGASLFIPAMSVHAEEVKLDLDAVEVVDERNSDTQPVIGYKATNSTTVTRTDTPLRDVPQSITVITEDVVKDLSVQSMAQAVEYVPGVQAAQGEGNRDAIIFRGNQTTSDLFVDGMRDDVQIFRDLYNTERVEVIKGANGMVSGRGGAGGIINRVTKQAGWDPVKELRLSYGTYNHQRAQIDFGQGLTDDVAFRLNAVYENSDSYRSGVDLERFGLNPTFTIKPDEATKITLGLEYFKDRRIGDRGVPSVKGDDDSDLNNKPYDLDDYSQFFGNAALSPNQSEVTAFNAMFEHDFDNGLKLRNRTRVANYNKFYQNVYAGGSIQADNTLKLKSYRDETDREIFTNQTDLIYTLDAGALEHKLLASFEYTAQDNTNRRLYPTQSNNGNSGGTFTEIPVSNPTVTGLTFTNAKRDQTTDVEVFALSLQDQVKFNDHWQAVVGLRYDDVKMDYFDFKATNDQDEVVGKGDVINDYLISPRIGLIYKPIQPVSIYANYSMTKVPRTGDQLVSLRGNLDSADFRPEKFINQEIGAKWDINASLALNMAIYKLERENVLTADPNSAGDNILVDGQETKGFELSLNGQVTDKWSMIAALTLQDAKLTKAVGSSPSGAQLANTPDRSLSLWNKYQINDIWAVALGVVSVSERLAAIETVSATTIMAGYTRYDAAVFADFTDDLRLQINIENLTDKAYAVYGHNTNNITPGSPLTGRASLIYNF